MPGWRSSGTCQKHRFCNLYPHRMDQNIELSMVTHVFTRFTSVSNVCESLVCGHCTLALGSIKTHFKMDAIISSATGSVTFPYLQEFLFMERSNLLQGYALFSGSNIPKIFFERGTKLRLSFNLACLTELCMLQSY